MCSSHKILRLRADINPVVLFVALHETRSHDPVSLQVESEVEPMSHPGDGKKVRGLVAARHGVASVIVNNSQADLELSPEGTLGAWHATVESSPESVSITVSIEMETN